MTREDAIRMAREAGLVAASFCRWSAYPDDLERFAALVAAAEREACAEILERNAEVCKDNSMLADVLIGNALAIRARRSE